MVSFEGVKSKLKPGLGTEKPLPGVSKAMTVKFSNGEVVTLNVGKALRKKNTAGVRYIMDPANFHKVVVKDFTATWDNGVGFDPDRMYLIWPRGEAPQS